MNHHFPQVSPVVLKAGETVLQALLRKAFETLQEDGLL
jgi:hypothetical protein